MERVYQYIKRLLVFFLILIVYTASFEYIPLYLSTPLLLLAFSILHSRITGQKPPHLFAYFRTENYFKKGGLRDLIRILVTLFGFIHDVVVWAIWGIYLIFLLFVDLLDLLKTILYWVVHAIVWFLRQYVPFIVFLYKIFIHYLIRWPWWLYQLAYFNIRYAFNRNCYRIALIGTLIASGIIFIFLYLGVFIIEDTGITYIGIIIALLPLTWSFGEIATIRVHKLENTSYADVKLKFQNGLEAVRSILFYITLFVVLLIAQLLLNLFGWIPNSGIVIAGFFFTINTLISLALLFIAILTILGVIIIPSHRLYRNFSEIKTPDTLVLFKTIFNKVLQYIHVLIPGLLFSVIIIALPVIVVTLAGFTTFKIKNGITDIRIEKLRIDQATSDNNQLAYSLGKSIQHLEALKQFPLNLPQEIQNTGGLNNTLLIAKEEYKSASEEYIKHNEELNSKADTLQKVITYRKSLNATDPVLKGLNAQLSGIQKNQKVYEAAKKLELAKLQMDIDYLTRHKKQIPLLYLLGGIWVVVLISLVIAFIVAYLGNIFHEVYVFRNDNTPTEWRNIVLEERAKDHKQPLLGGTLFVISVFVIYQISSSIQFGAGLLDVISNIAGW